MYQINRDLIKDFFEKEGREIYETAKKTLAEYKMESYLSSGVLLGLSGGADSVMLLIFLLEYKRRNNLDFHLVCMHVNHGIRDEEANRDERFCRELCEALEVELVTRAFSVPTIARGSHTGLEEAARIVRYSAFNMIISGRNDLNTIAVAHNMSDSAETVIFNILRGSGARGASGIRPVRENIIRPLIRISKKDILSAMENGNIPFVTDSTNFSNDYTRNYIRNELMASMGKISSDPEKMISRFADNLRSDDDYIRQVANRFIESHSPVMNTDLASLHFSVFVRVLSILAERKGVSVSYRIALDIFALLSKNNFSYSLIGKASFVCERGECRIAPDTSEGRDFCFEVGEGVTELNPFNAVFVLSNENFEKTYSKVYKISIQASLSSAIIKGGLYLRSKKDGDTVYYGGMTHKLKKLFSDAKIPRSKRKLLPILCDDNGVVWVPGFGVRDDGVKKDEGRKINVLLAINENADSDTDRLYSASEFRT